MRPERTGPSENDMFARCAGVFQAFSTLENRIGEAIEAGHTHQAAALLFGERFDSLGTLLDRVLREGTDLADEDRLDDIDSYLVLMCAQQLSKVVADGYQLLWSEYEQQVSLLNERLSRRAALRERLIATDPLQMGAFLDWFDHWFLLRARPVESADEGDES